MTQSDEHFFEHSEVLIDQNLIWHPYTSMTDNMPVFHVEAAEGVYLHLKNGPTLIDGMASWWCAIHGYAHPKMNKAMAQQAELMSHVMFGGLTHTPAIKLAEKLVAITPSSLKTVFFSDSGSVAVEVAIKMAFQYWKAKNQPQRKQLLTIRRGYHGDTLGAMSVCDPETGMHHLFTPILSRHLFSEAPACTFETSWDERYIGNFKSLIHRHHNEIAAVILEPIVQGAGGMRFYAPQYLKRVSELCQEKGILLILDEIATGFSRTGTLFACEHADVEPDIMCLGKALTGGYMTLAATLCTQDISHTISEKGPFMHGPTFMANPLACHIAYTSIKMLEEMNWPYHVTRIEKALKEGLQPCCRLPYVHDVRVLGAIGVVELTHPVNLKTIQPQFVDLGVWVRPFHNLIYVIPPYIIDNKEINFLCDAIHCVVQRFSPD